MVRRALILLCLFSAALAFAQQPQITQGPKVEHTDSTTAVIAWSTNVSAGTLVKYGTDPNNLSQSVTMPWGGFTHRVMLKDLKPNTTYFFKAVSGQAQGSGAQITSDVAQFQTIDGNAAPARANMAPAPTTPATVIAGPIPQHITSTSATIWWEVPSATGLTVRFGTVPNALNQTAQETPATSNKGHKVQLTGLQPGSTYYVALVDTSNNQLATVDFRTRPAKATAEADITNGPVIEFIGDREAVIAWSSSRKSISVLNYGTDPSNLSLSTTAPRTGDGTHRVHLVNLQPNTKYWFQIQPAQSQEEAADTSGGPKYPFRTVSNASAALKLVP